MKRNPIRLMLVLGVALALSTQLSANELTANELTAYSQAVKAAVEAGEKPAPQVRITFPYGVGKLEESFGNNAAGMRSLKAMVRDHKNDMILVMAYASPEGNSASNLVLTNKRAHSVKDYLVAQGFPVEQIVVRTAGEDWDGLKDMIGNKEFTGKAEVLRILSDDSLSSAQKKARVQEVAGGKAWDWLVGNVMADLRSVQVYTFTKEDLQKFLNGTLVQQQPAEQTAQPAAKATEPEKTQPVTPVVEETVPETVAEPEPVKKPETVVQPETTKQPETTQQPAAPVVVKGQKHQVTGRVVEAETGEPVIAAGVLLSTGTGTTTDFDGYYTIMATDTDVLTFSSVGYQEVTETVGLRSVIDVALPTDSMLLEEVVVLGYTTQKKAELSSAVVTVAADKLTDVTTPDVGNMLQGKVAGVMVMNSSGQPGEGAAIRIRGTGSITAGAGPLYVVDGVAGGAFNPNDVETLTVLKDASATALYGAAAAGGVIVITTKSAKSDEAQVNFKASVGIKRALMGHFKAMDAKELYEFNELFRSESWLSKVSNIPSKEDIDAGMYNFDWIGNTFKTGIVRNYYVSTSGKAGKISYYASIDHYNEQGSLINSGYRRTAARVNLTAPITERLTMNLRMNYSKSYTNSARWKTRESAYVMLPFDNPFTLDKDGNQVSDDPVLINSVTRPDNKKRWYSKNTYNYFHNELYNYARGHDEGLTGDLQLVWNVTDWLTLTSTNRYDSSGSYSEEYLDPRTSEVEDDKGSISKSEGEWNGWGTTNIAKFYKTFGVHDVNAIVGWEYGEGYTRFWGVSGGEMPAGQRSLSNCSPASILIDSDRDYNTRTWALLSQAQYSYLGKYILTASLRYDESYKFGPLNRGGYFPGASAAWVISNEPFMSGNRWFSFLKLRAGYGKTGNDSIEAFKYQDILALNAYYNNAVSAVVKQQANYNLGWEEAYMTSLGVDATIKNNWNVTLDLYHTINDKLLLERDMPPSSGFFSVMDNVGKVRNMGLELAIDGTILKKGNFTWDGGFNLGMNQNRVLELPEHNDMPLGDKVKQMVIEGRDIYSWYMPKWAGVDVNTGRPLWEHLEYDDEGNVIETTLVDTYGDATYQVVGSASPWFTGGVNTSLRWKSLTLSATGSFVVGNRIFNATRMNIMDTDGAQPGFNMQSLDNGLGWIRWIDGDPFGTNYKATHPEAMNGGNSDAHNYSSRYLEDGSFFRLRNVTLSYDLPTKLLSKAHIGAARVYVSADNLYTLTRFSGMDPEVSLEMSTYSLPGLYSDNYPVPMSVVLGIDVKF